METSFFNEKSTHFSQYLFEIIYSGNWIVVLPTTQRFLNDTRPNDTLKSFQLVENQTITRSFTRKDNAIDVDFETKRKFIVPYKYNSTLFADFQKPLES